MGLLYVDLYVGPDLVSLGDKLVQARLAMSGKMSAPIIPPPFTLAKGDYLSVNIPVAENPWDFYILDVRQDS